MNVIKKEPEVDPLAIEWCDDTDTVEKKHLSEDGNVLDLHVTEIKTECMDQSYALKSEMTFEESPVPIDFPVVKIEAKEETPEINKVEDQIRLEVTAQEDEILSDRKELRQPSY
ncbi:uncharacterized protein [Periplaneta americana]|uniref:uncharacterized protein isoform X6 n=1 Tax=Periplaneta americana TaxID=6978 RepID=UPI0037E7062F